MSIRVAKKINLKDRLTLQLNDFKGVDFSSSPLHVSSNRATYMKNFINENGVNRKRNGWKELIKIVDNDIPLRINGIFTYKRGDVKTTIVHAGTKFFKLIKTPNVNYYKAYSYTEIPVASTYIEDKPSQAFMSNEKLYIIGCGDFLVYGTWDNGNSYQLKRVVDSDDVYIPTTYISGDADNNLTGVSSTLDEPNLLTNKRINKFCGEDSESFTFTVDGKEIYDDWDITQGEENDQFFEITLETIYYKPNDPTKYLRKTIISPTLTTQENPTLNRYTYISAYYGTISYFAYLYVKEDKAVAVNNEQDEIFFLPDGNNVGKVDFTNGEITINRNTQPQIEGRDNITVKFKPKVGSDNSDKICKSNFGILFGTNGNSNRLFLAGNDDYKNIDFYSAIDNFSYFPDINYVKVGSPAYAIKGYARLSDSSMAIFKEDNNQEATIYYRTGYDLDDADNYETTAIFKTTAGSIGESMVTMRANGNLAGDVLMLSQNGVFGITLGDNVSTTVRYARERSRYVNEKLMHESLEDAVAVVFKNRYYLAVNDTCYVADARFVSQSDGDMGDTFNYEWWFWDNVPVRVWFVDNDELYFGTADGMICVFDTEFTDRTFYKTSIGQMSPSRDCITYEQSLDDKIVENNEIYLLSAKVSELVLDNNPTTGLPYCGGVRTVDGSNSLFLLNPDDIGKFYNGMVVYADYYLYSAGNSPDPALNTKYEISDIDIAEGCFKLKKVSDGTYSALRGAGKFRLLRKLEDEPLLITNVDRENCRFGLRRKTDTEALNLENYNNSADSSLQVALIFKDNVICEWYTPMFDMGTNQYSKTLLKLTISTDPTTNDLLEFGYETKNISRLQLNISLDNAKVLGYESDDVSQMYKAKGLRAFSFDDLDFSNFSFDSSFAHSYTKNVLVRNFNYIMFKFKSTSDKNCIINNLSAMYKVNKINKGVK